MDYIISDRDVPYVSANSLSLQKSCPACRRARRTSRVAEAAAQAGVPTSDVAVAIREAK